LIFLEQNPLINFFDLYRPAWEYLKNSAKFQSITVALKSAPHAAGTSKSDVSMEVTESDRAALSTVARAARPMGNKKSKCCEEEGRKQKLRMWSMQSKAAYRQVKGTIVLPL
jgi:hypothetical protein